VVTAPFYGLILAGGKSSRMKQPKWALSYHGKTQIEKCLDLLSPRCSKIFISSRPEQQISKQIPGITEIYDKYADIGPMSGIISAMQTHPRAAWLVLACDLPQLDSCWKPLTSAPTTNHLAFEEK